VWEEKKKEGGIKTSCTIRVGAKLYWCMSTKLVLFPSESWIEWLSVRLVSGSGLSIPFILYLRRSNEFTVDVSENVLFLSQDSATFNWRFSITLRFNVFLLEGRFKWNLPLHDRFDFALNNCNWVWYNIVTKLIFRAS
jgi:hypothetical protein